MKSPISKWVYSLDTEVDRLIQAYHSTANGFYQHNGFLVLPYECLGNPQTVYLPDLGMGSDLFKMSAKLAPAIPMTDDIKLLNIFKAKIADNIHIFDFEKIKRYQADWGRVESEFWRQTYAMFPWVDLKELEIRPTKYGCLSSFHLSGKKLYVSIRLDMDISHLAEAIISGLLMDKLKAKGVSWQEKEAVVDTLLSIGSYATIFPKYQNTLTVIKEKQTAQLKLVSIKYLKKLGQYRLTSLTLANNHLLYEGKTIDQHLNQNEADILKHLLTNKNCLCSVESLADIMWKDENSDQFSLWAISKTIQRLRDKLTNLGINSDIIQTKRKLGYVLVD